MTGDEHDDLRHRFTDAYGGEPDGVWAAPGRVNLIGEHTDYNDGFVLPFAIEQQTFVAARISTGRGSGERQVRVASLQKPEDAVSVALDDVRPGEPGGWSSYVFGVLWALREDGHALGGIDLLVDGHVPLGSGLSSSASLECSTALALNELFGLSVAPDRLALLAQRAENDFVGAPTGPMDQRASMLCTEGHALLLDNRSMETEQVPLDAAADGLALVLVDTGVHHAHADGAYGERRRSCELAGQRLGVKALRDVEAAGLDEALARLDDDELRRRVRHVVTENARTEATAAALRRGDWAGVGRLMTESHLSMRDDYEISCAELDVVVETALEQGALGARMTGGGFGGCAVMLARADEVDGLTAAVEGAYAEAGYRPPTWFTTAPGPGARRVG